MNIPRVGHAAFALSGRIYAVGGMDGKVPKTWRKHPCDDVFFFFGVVHVNDEVFEHSGSTKELCRFFLLPLVFSYTSSLTSTSFVVPKTAPWVFLSPKPVA